MAATIPESAYHYFDNPNFANVATVMSNGAPHVTPVWIDRDGDMILFNTARGRVKEQNIARDPRVALSVLDPSNPYHYIQVRGRAELVDEGADAHIDRLAKKYLGEDEYPLRQPGERRVTVRVTPEAVRLMGG